MVVGIGVCFFVRGIRLWFLGSLCFGFWGGLAVVWCSYLLPYHDSKLEQGKGLETLALNAGFAFKLKVIWRGLGASYIHIHYEKAIVQDKV